MNEEEEYRIWSSGKQPVSKPSDNRQDLGEKKGNPPKRYPVVNTNEQSTELNDIPFAVKHADNLGTVVIIILIGGAVIITIIVPAGEGGTWITLMLLHMFLFIFLGYHLIALPTKEYKERQKLATEASRKRTQEKKKKNQEQKRKRDLEQRERELEGAKRLMEEGGIENLNRAIGIFKKYG